MGRNNQSMLTNYPNPLKTSDFGAGLNVNDNSKRIKTRNPSLHKNHQTISNTRINDSLLIYQ